MVPLMDRTLEYPELASCPSLLLELLEGRRLAALAEAAAAATGNDREAGAGCGADGHRN